MIRHYALACFVVALSYATVTSAQVKEADAKAMLESSDADEVQQGIEGLTAIGSARAARALADRVQRGLPPRLLASATESLGLIGNKEAAPVLFTLLSHRRAPIRLRAIEALVAIAPKGVASALSQSLSDSNAEVRASAALGLGQVGDVSSLERLFHALDRGVAESTTSIGKLADQAAIKKLLKYTGRLPLDGLTPGFDEILARKKIPTNDKLLIVNTLSELATPAVRDYLAQIKEGSKDKAIIKAVDLALERIAP